MSERATRLHASPWQGACFVTGGGSLFLSELLTTPGASATVLDVQVPYATSALTQLLGGAPAQAASNATARQLAVAAYHRAVQLTGNDSPTHCFGLGCTASLGTNRQKRGTHRAHWTLQTARKTYTFEATYSSDRATEEALLTEQLWETVNAVLLDDPLHGDAYQIQRAEPDAEISKLLHPTPHKVCVGEHGGQLILPGSFNPLHEGHENILTLGEQLTGQPGAYELTLRNADKPGLDFVTVQERLAQFAAPVWLTNTPTFAGKAQLFPGAAFLVGVDTMQRIGSLRFYGNDVRQLDEAIALFHDLGTQFIVFGRRDGDRFLTLDHLALPDALQTLCRAVSEDEFRSDLSSTELRTGN